MSELLHAFPWAEYDALKRVNYSRLRLMGKSPAHYAHGTSKDSTARKLGRVGHVLTLEPERFDSAFVVNDENRNSNSFKAVKAAAEQAGKEVIKQAERDEGHRLRNAIFANKDAASLLSKGMPELTVLWEQAGAGFSFEFKARPDWLSEDDVLVEVKTCRDASERGFGKQAGQLCYPAQLAFYRQGLQHVLKRRVRQVVTIAVETVAPYPVTVFEVKETDLDWGWDRCATYLDRLAECQRTGEFPEYARGRVTLEIPSWAVEDFDEETEEEAA